MQELAENKRAFFEYEILEKFEAGLVLDGNEVKSIRAKHIALKEAFITFQKSCAYLTNAHIPPYPYMGSTETYNPTRPRALLLHRKEQRYLQAKFFEKGLTIVPLKVYTNGHWIKVQIALVRGKHQYDKRDALKKRDLDREVASTRKMLSF